MTQTTVYTANGHDNGYDLIAGDVTNPRIGRVYWDDAGLDGGLVIALDSGEEDTPADAQDAAAWLAEHGYVPDADAERAIAALGQSSDVTSTTVETPDTILLLGNADLFDAGPGGGAEAEARDQHGDWHTLPRLTEQQVAALTDGELVEVDGLTLICPRWPQTVRQHHLGHRPAEQLAERIGHSRANPDVTAAIEQLRAEGRIS